MNNYFKFLIVFIAGEVVAYPIFHIVRKAWNMDTTGTSWKAIIGGWIERVVLFFGMATGVTQVIIMFGTLKIGSMVTKTKEDKRSSDYFLTGNLISVLFALLYLFIYIKWKGVPV